MSRRGITYATLEHDLQDIAGLRVMVQFVDDVKEVVEICASVKICGLYRSEITLLIEKHRATVPITW